MFRFACLLIALALPSVADAAGPQPPCDGSAVPGFGALDGPPAVAAWSHTDLRRAGWQPPACLGWQGDSRLVVALAARFHSPLTLDELADRLVAVSQHPSIRIWAVTRQEWRPLALDAWALDGPADKMRRPDPSGGALLPGRDFFYAENTDVGGRSVYRLHVAEHTADRIVLTTENVTAIRAAIVTLFEPGALQVATVLSRDGPGSWNLYEISRAGADSSSFVASYQSSYLNRLEAMRRHLAGVPTDRDPPIAPW
jgi:uncharacterized protein DUF6675